MTRLFNYSVVSFISMVIGFLLFLGLMKHCQSPMPTASRTIRIDTVWVQGPVKDTTIIKWKTIPVLVQLTPPAELRKNWCDSIRFYSDTTQLDTNSYVVCLDTVVGIKKWSAIKYFAHPYFRQITNTITDSIPYAVNTPKRSLYLVGGVGIGLVNHLYIGVDYFGKKKIGVGFLYDLPQQSYNVLFKVKLF